MFSAYTMPTTSYTMLHYIIPCNAMLKHSTIFFHFTTIFILQQSSSLAFLSLDWSIFLLWIRKFWYLNINHDCNKHKIGNQVTRHCLRGTRAVYHAWDMSRRTVGQDGVFRSSIEMIKFPYQIVFCKMQLNVIFDNFLYV